MSLQRMMRRLVAASGQRVSGRVWLLVVFFLLFVSCSTTRKLGDDEVLYIGVKKIAVDMPKGFKLDVPEKSALYSPLSYPPNSSLYTPYIRSPFPLGLWVYNWNIKREKGIKWWLYKNLSQKPVLVSNVQPELRLKMVNNSLKDLGFFHIQSSYEVLPQKRNPKKAKLSYRISISEDRKSVV